MSEIENSGRSRRSFIAGMGLAGLATGCGPALEYRPAAAGVPSPTPVPAAGATQAGLVRPAEPQPYAELLVFELDAARSGTGRTDRVLAGLGEHILAMTGGRDPALAGLPPGDLTVTVGVGPGPAAALPHGLPAFARERIPPGHRDGDLMVQVCAGDPLVVSLAAESVRARLGARVRWRQSGFRGPKYGPAGRNLLGFLDGIVQPGTEPDLPVNVWLSEPAGATIAVVRRIRLDVARFLALPLAEQERIVGRRRADGAPLSGGGPGAAADLSAKTPDGHWMIPADSHVRLAHPLPAGVDLMLRRPYTYDNGPDDRGLLFISFQRDLRTFAATHLRMDEGDRLMTFTVTTAAGAFLILPGFSAERPLGSGVF